MINYVGINLVHNSDIAMGITYMANAYCLMV